jgi:two-component system sensor histidine kinase YesM
MKINLVLLSLVLPIVALNAYSNHTSIRVIESELKSNNENQLLFLENQIETNLDRLSSSLAILTRDSSILQLERYYLGQKYYDIFKLQSQIEEKLFLQSFSSNWSNDITVFLPNAERRISTDNRDRYDSAVFDGAVFGKWRYWQADDTIPAGFSLSLTDPFINKTDIRKANAVFEVRFSDANIRRLFATYTNGSDSQPFLLSQTGSIIGNASNDDPMVRFFAKRVQSEEHREIAHERVSFDKQKFYITYAYIAPLNAYLVDYVPLDHILSPIVHSRNLFYGSLVLLFVLGFSSSVILYRQVQKPISALIKGLKQVSMGNYSFFLNKKYNNEFDYLMFRFNEMSAKIGHLIENVYEEQNRSRLAVLKQLQAQINPHFLYNALSFIAGSAKMGDTESIRTMAYHLGDYYRYTTRVENQMPLLKEEMELVKNYLAIYSMRMERIAYEIDMPGELMDAPAIRLMVQPIVENAIIHGLEPKLGKGTIRVTGYRAGEHIMLAVEDDGVGMSDDELEKLRESLEQPMEDKTGCGLWNVHQRLKHRFGPQAGLHVMRSGRSDGLSVTLRWNESSL